MKTVFKSQHNLITMVEMEMSEEQRKSRKNLWSILAYPILFTLFCIVYFGIAVIFFNEDGGELAFILPPFLIIAIILMIIGTIRFFKYVINYHNDSKTKIIIGIILLTFWGPMILLLAELLFFFSEIGSP